MSSIADNIGSVTRRIQKATLQAGREPGSVRLLAVSKTRPAEDLKAAFEAGQVAAPLQKVGSDLYTKIGDAWCVLNMEQVLILMEMEQ